MNVDLSFEPDDPETHENDCDSLVTVSKMSSMFYKNICLVETNCMDELLNFSEISVYILGCGTLFLVAYLWIWNKKARKVHNCNTCCQWSFL